jgi:hypothetical protein
VSHSGRCMVELPALVALILLACAAGSAQASPNNNNKKTFRFPTVPAPANNRMAIISVCPKPKWAGADPCSRICLLRQERGIERRSSEGPCQSS